MSILQGVVTCALPQQPSSFIHWADSLRARKLNLDWAADRVFDLLLYLCTIDELKNKLRRLRRPCGTDTVLALQPRVFHCEGHIQNQSVERVSNGTQPKCHPHRCGSLGARGTTITTSKDCIASWLPPGKSFPKGNNLALDIGLCNILKETKFICVVSTQLSGSQMKIMHRNLSPFSRNILN